MRSHLRTALFAAALVVLVSGAGLADRETAGFFADRGEKALRDADLPGAEEHFRRALQEDADYAPARFGLARTLIAGERRDDGIAELKRAVLELGGEPQFRPTLVKARKLLDDLDRAGAALRAMVDAHVEDLVTFARRWIKKDPDTAVRALRSALHFSPGHEKATEMIESLGYSAKGAPRSLFDGESLAGWVEMSPPRWSAGGGVIVGDVQDSAYIGRSERSFEGDYDVRMEARLLAEYDGPSYFALSPAFDGREGHYAFGVLKGKFIFQEDVDAQTDRDVFSGNPPHDFDVKDWHVYELRFRGRKVTAVVDGREIAVDEERPARRESGFVGLTCQNCKFEIRRVEVTQR